MSRCRIRHDATPDNGSRLSQQMFHEHTATQMPNSRAAFVENVFHEMHPRNRPRITRESLAGRRNSYDPGGARRADRLHPCPGEAFIMLAHIAYFRWFAGHTPEQ